MTQQCFNAIIQAKAKSDPFPMGWDTQDKLTKKHDEPLGDLLEIPLSRKDPSWIVRIGSDLDQVTKKWLTTFLRKIPIYLLGLPLICQK